MNKKIFKSITFAIPVFLGCITACSAFATSFRSSSEDDVVSGTLPEYVYKFSDDGKTLLGFQGAFLNNPDSEIYKDNFKDCDTMEIPDEVESIADSAFYSSASTIPIFITKLTFAKNSNCSTIGDLAFPFCSSLASIDLSNNKLSSIGQGAFGECSKLTSVDFPSSLETIGAQAFYRCSSLASVAFPSHLTKVEGGAFENCSKLTSVIFPSSLTTIYADAFENCPNLSSITWDAWTGSHDSLDSDTFGDVCKTRGTVRVTNPKDDAHDSVALLACLKKYCGLPSAWEVAKD